jgi:magnesium-transporting ATPase (P-type)
VTSSSVHNGSGRGSCQPVRLASVNVVIIAVLATLMFLGARCLWRAFRRQSGAHATSAIWWGMGMALAAVVLTVPPLVMAFAEVANVPPADKSAVLARGIAGAMTYTRPGVLAGLLLAFVGGVARGLYGPAKKPSAQPAPAK